jgi:hypothetical protein
MKIYRNAYGRFTPQPKPGREPVLQALSADKLDNAKALLASRFGGVVK